MTFVDDIEHCDDEDDDDFNKFQQGHRIDIIIIFFLVSFHL